MLTSAEVRERIQGWERGAAKLRVIVAKQEPVECDSDGSCYEKDTEEMQHLKHLEGQISRWRVCLAALELYERQTVDVKSDDDIESVWAILQRNFEWAADRASFSEGRFEKAAVKAMYSPHADVHAFMRDLVYVQNSGPYGYYLLPQEFMRSVVRLGLMERPSLKLDVARPVPTTAAGQ